MGSNQLISAKEAAAILGLGAGSINTYVRRGMLQPVYSKGRRMNDRRYRRDEVAALAEARERGLCLPRVASMAARSFASARVLEHRVERLEQILGVGMDPLPLDEESVLSLYAEASDKLRPARKLDDLMRWTRVLLSMGEEFFELLEAYTGDEHSWLAFMEFARATLEAAPLEPEPELKQAYGMMLAARNHLRNVCYMFVRNRYGARKANHVFFGDEHDDVLRITQQLRKR